MEIETILKYSAFIPEKLTSLLIELLKKVGLAENLSERTSVLIYWLIIFSLIFIAIKVLEKANWLIKIIIISLAIFLIVSFFLPVW